MRVLTPDLSCLNQTRITTLRSQICYRKHLNRLRDCGGRTSVPGCLRVIPIPERDSSDFETNASLGAGVGLNLNSLGPGSIPSIGNSNGSSEAV